MRLKYVYISEYKNLKNFEVDFVGENFLNVIVGKNGSGKSNFFEALVVIFRNLYEFGKESAAVYFDYKLIYELEGRDIEVVFKNLELSIDGADKVKPGDNDLPDNILVYYSGQNDTLEELMNTYEELFSDNVKTAKITDFRKFIRIGKSYKELLLCLLLIQPGSSKPKKFLFEKLGIKQISSDLRLVFSRPNYAKGNSRFDIVNNDNDDKYWKAEGIARQFIDELDECLVVNTGQGVRSEGYFSDNQEYIQYYNINQFLEKFQDLRLHELFRAFDNLKVIGMLSQISIGIKLDSDRDASISDFSDGQFQSIYVYAITELFKESNCITLLDEPDSFLHPEWQFEFLKQVNDISDGASKTNHVLMSSHSAVTLIPHDDTKVKFFDINNALAHCYELPKHVAVKKLSSDIIKFSEQEQLLSILHRVGVENKPVLFTEGHTDAKIIMEAWRKLYEEEMPFIPYYAFSCTFINQLIRDDRIHNEMNGLPLFALFDFDVAYSQWDGLKGEIIGDDLAKGLIKKWDSGESYALMMPVPDNADVKKQVIKNEQTGESFGDKSCCEIEHMFYGVESLEEYFVKEPCPGGEKIVFISDGAKVDFAEQVVPGLGEESFEVFRPMFEFIKSKCGVGLDTENAA